MLTNASTEKLYDQYRSTLQKIADVKYASAVLQWDQETYLPLKGADKRGQQLATLSEVSHQMFTDEKLGGLLQELNGRTDLSFIQKQNVSLSLEDYIKLKKFSPDFVRTMSEAISASFHAWVEARKQNSFRIFQPLLSRIVELKKEEADIIGYEAHPYNALMNEYEKGATVQVVDQIFNDLTPSLSSLLQDVQQFPVPNDSFLHSHFPKQQQWEWGMYIAKQMGFDFEAGRQDISEHPFTINFSSKDVRITTRIDENDFANMMWSTIHEVGHALYEQGLPDSEYGLPSGEYTSLSIHESQSRLWENCVGRGATFWKYYLPKLKEFFPGKLDDLSLENYLKAINKVKPSLIRTEADELTYHFHVMIRYELEKQLIAGNLPVKDIPAFWNEQYKKLLHVDVPDDKNGCLQDVHWSHGSFGYFATYSLGSFYAAQFWEQAKKDIPSLENEIKTSGSTQYLLEWLRCKIHVHGKVFTSRQLCTSVTGSEIDSKVFINYLRTKLNLIYS
ncbi:MAG TPA: carboxypeptidase M32 [Segetibacter sp.]|jgi:carboxypeptidase Taq